VTSTDPQIIKAALDQVHDLILADWNEIQDIASDPEQDGEVSVNISLKFDFNGKVPACGFKTAFMKKGGRDGVVKLEDPDQTQMPIGDKKRGVK